jgi:hypothetical protein
MVSLGSTARPAAAGVQETLGWEAEHRPRAGIASILAGLLILAGAIIEGLSTRGRPTAPLIEALKGALQGDPKRPSGQVALFGFLDDRIVPLTLASVLPALGFLALIPVLGYLFRAVSAREPKIPRAALILGLIGPALVGIGSIAFQIGLGTQVHKFLTGSDRTIGAANDVGSSALISAGQLMQLAGTLATAFALLFIALNAMRVGLLTRFMGILGIISGVALVFLPRNPVINFWLIALGVLILGRWPGGTPAAWGSGRAEPWPTQQELRERRDQPAAEPGPAPGPAAGDSGAAERPPLQKRKRKRR